MKPRLLAALILLAIIATGCRDDDDRAVKDVTPSPTVTSAPTAAPSAPPATPAPASSPRPVNPGATAADLTAIVERAKTDLDAFWRAQIPITWPAGGYRYTSPVAFHPYRPGTRPPSRCAPADSKLLLNNAFYCRLDRSIAWDEAWMLRELQQHGPMAVISIFAHEWGHHVQELTKVPEISLRAELQGDCYAGMYVAQAGKQGALRAQEVEAVADQFFRVGNPVFSDALWFLEGEHGAPLQRKVAYLAGYSGADAQRCVTFGEYNAESVFDLGPLLLAVMPQTLVWPELGGRTSLTPPRNSFSQSCGLAAVCTTRAIVEWYRRLPGATDTSTPTPQAALEAIWKERNPFGFNAVRVGPPQPVTVDGRPGAGLAQGYIDSEPRGATVYGLLYVEPVGGGVLVIDVRGSGIGSLYEPALREEMTRYFALLRAGTFVKSR